MLTGFLKTEEEYNKALKRLDEIFNASTGSKEGDEAELLVHLIENYENIHYPNDPSDLHVVLGL